MKPKSLHLNLKYVLNSLLVILLLLAFSINGKAQCGGDVLIDNESFESGWGIWNSGGVDAFRSASNANTGSYSVDIQDNSGVASSFYTNSLDLSAYTSINVNFSYLAISMDNANEDFWLQISTDGGTNFTTFTTYAQSIDFNNNVRENESVTITGPFTSTTQLRFLCDASGNADDVYIDDVVICGTLPGPCSGGITSFPYTEGFESGWGAWTQLAIDDFDWINQSGGTPSSGTGPSSANEGSQYIYVEASSKLFK
ncbi:MAG: hypothetical protein R2728_02685 [Chitinophagales bacterium]